MESTPLKAMALRIGVAAGFDPTIIIAIISAIIQFIQGCKKPANEADAQSLLAEVAENHPDSPPFWLRPAIRSKLPKDRRDLRSVNTIWAAIVDDTQAHPQEAVQVMLAA